uniref:Ig-like domain-containing protein n=1 Tax=Meleagris gallopavo TaxID=9103 RepID=A0A803Y9G4_MELGA
GTLIPLWDTIFLIQTLHPLRGHPSRVGTPGPSERPSWGHRGPYREKVTVMGTWCPRGQERMDGAGKVLWYRHRPGEPPRLLLNCIDERWDVFSCEYQNSFAVLHIQAAQPKDAALYLCANSIVSKLQFSNGTVLLVGGRKAWGDPEAPLDGNPTIPTERDPSVCPISHSPLLPLLRRASQWVGTPTSLHWLRLSMLPSLAGTTPISPHWMRPPTDLCLVCPQRSPIACCPPSMSSPLKWTLMPPPVLVIPTSLP